MSQGASQLVNSIIFRFLLFIFLSTLPHTLCGEVSEGEALFVRRILQFWKEREIVLVKAQISDFFKQYPESEYRDSLLVVYGDVEWESCRYAEALHHYNSINAEHFQDKVFNNRLDCFYRLGRYEDLKAALQSKGDFHQKEFLSHDELVWLFFYAEALLHQAMGEGDEEKENLVTEAKGHYQRLLDSDHKMNAHLALGEIHVIIGAPDQAAAHYLEASKGLPDREEELIFQAAHLKGKYHPEEALALFERVSKMDGEKKGEAALAKAALLFDREQYKELLASADELRSAFSMDDRYLLDIYIGRSNLALKQYEKAIEVLKPILEYPSASFNDDDESVKTVYLTLIVGYEQMNRQKETIEIVDLFKARFPTDAALPKVLYLEALALKSLEKYREAWALIRKVISEYPKDENRESLDFESSFILFKLGQWKESRDGFVAFTQEYPESLLEYPALSYAAHASVKLMEAQKSASEEILDQLISDLEKLLKHPSIASNAQKPKYMLLLGKAYADLQKYPKARPVIEAYIKDYPQDEDLFQGYLLMANCCKEGAQDLIGFTDHGEHVLRIKPDYEHKRILQLNLFTAYLELSRQDPGKNGINASPYLDLAADHLYNVMKEDSTLVKSENKLWLANHYYNKSGSGANDYFIDPLDDPEKIEFARRGAAAYELAIVKKESLNKESLHLEAELLKWSNLYGWMGDLKYQISLLEQLVNQQRNQSDLPWKLRSRSQFSLARAYRAFGNTKEAMKIYETLRNQSKNSDLTVANGAQLEWARLTLAEIPMEERKIDNKKIGAVLKTLKELQARKSLPQEPIHLEAGMEYAALSSSLEEVGVRLERYKALLENMKETFSNRDDLWSKDYYASRRMHPEKDFIYHAYMMLIDGRIIATEAKIAAFEGRNAEAEVKSESAKAIYGSLTKGKLAVSKYLVDQAKLGLKEIEEGF